MQMIIRKHLKSYEIRCFFGQGTQFVGMGLILSKPFTYKAKLDTYAKDLNLDLISLLNDSENQ